MDIATIYFEYTSSRGERTKRTVDAKAFGRNGFEGHCHLRNKQRTFYFQYMENCIDTTTGQIVGDILKFFGEKLKQYKCKTATEEADRFFFLEHDFLLVLVYVGRLSSVLAKKKKMVIAEACCELHGDKFVSFLDFDFLSNGFNFYNTEGEFEQALDNIVKEKDKKREIIIKAAQKMAAIPKEPSKEKAMAEYLKKRLS